MPQTQTGTHDKRAVNLSILVAALGYFVDIYDLILFSIVRVKSLISIGVPKEDLLQTGALLLNMQMGVMLIGGIIWGVLGDKRGRLSVLFGSIEMSSGTDNYYLYAVDVASTYLLSVAYFPLPVTGMAMMSTLSSASLLPPIFSVAGRGVFLADSTTPNIGEWLVRSDDYYINPVWSPDGSTIAVTVTTAAGTDLYTLPVTGDPLRQVTMTVQDDIPTQIEIIQGSTVLQSALQSVLAINPRLRPR